MEKRRSSVKRPLIVGLAMAILLSWSVMGSADFVTSKLAINPTPCKRGDALKFTVTIYHNPTASTMPGTAYSAAVVLDTTNHPELNNWHSEQKTFKYPAQGASVTLSFTNTYTVPQNLKGETICFYVTEGTAMANRISYKTCIPVKVSLKPELMQKKVIKP